MVMSPPSTTTKKREWVFYTPYTVRVKASGLLNVLTSRRSWSALRAVGVDPVLYHETLVLSLLLFTRPLSHLRGSRNGSVSSQNTRGWVSLFSGDRARLTLPCRMFVGDWTTSGRRGGKRAQRISSNFGPAGGTFNGVLHLDLCRVGFLRRVLLIRAQRAHPGWKSHSAAGSLHTSLKSEVADRPLVISPLVSSEV